MTRTLHLNSLVVAAALAALAACSGSSKPSLSSIAISPSSPSIPKGHTLALTANGSFSDGTKQPIANATWTSSDTAKATVSSSGLVTGVAEGAATITATSSGKSATAAITVTHSPLASIAATPSPVTLEIGATQALAVTATYEDTTTAALTSGVTFAVTAATPAGAATVDASGVVTAVAAGTATVTATNGGKTATVAVTINAPSLVSISVDASAVTLEITKTHTVVVTGSFTSGPNQTLTSGVTFAVTAGSSFATVGASSGVITAVAAGTATVTATASGKTATVTVTVNPKVLLSITATPNPVTLAAGFSQALTVSGLYSNGETTPPPPSLSFAVTAATPSGDVTVNSSSGLIAAVAPGTATIRVTSGTVHVDVGVTVTAATLDHIAIDQAPTVALFVTQQATLTVTGTFSDLSTLPLTTGVTFAVTAGPGFATVGSSSGVVTGVAAGSATVTATHTASGKTATVTVNVSAVVLQTITVGPNPVVLPTTTGTATFVVTGHYSDSHTAVIPNASVTFLSNSSSVVTVSGAGVITAGIAGTTTIAVTVSPAPAVDVPVQIYDPVSARVFYDDFDPGTYFLAFGGSTNDVSRDATTVNNGRASLKVVVGTVGSYTGGALVAPPHDLHTYNAISFWAKATTSVTMNSIGFGDTAAGGSGPLIVETHATPLTTTFTKYYIPIPNPASATAVVGLFYFADGLKGYTAWFNDIQYETLDGPTLASKFGTVSSVSVAWPSPTVAKGDTFQIDFNPNTVFYTVGPTLYRVGWNWFTLASDSTGVATVDTKGLITGQGAGTAHITAMLGSTSVAGQATVAGVLPLAVPTDIATAPTAPPGNVISMYGSTYTPVPIDSWSTSWSGCCNDYLEPYVILAHNVKRYTLRHFTGVEFGSNPINASAAGMTAFHMDYWTPNATEFFVRLVNNEGASQTESTVDATSTINLGHWVSLDIPLSQFSSLTGTDKLGQMLLLVTVGHSAVFYFDNIYFHK